MKNLINIGRIKTFPFWKDQYLFHPEATRKDSLLNFYHPYKKTAKLNWWLWKKSNLYQKLFTYNLNNNPKLYQFINTFLQINEDYVWVINRGSNFVFQKVTGLFISKHTTSFSKNFFFKWGDSAHAIESIKNEVALYNELNNNSLVPKLLEYKITEYEAYYTTEIIQGSKYTALEFNKDVLGLINQIESLRPQQVKKYSLSDNLITSFCHGDFCPWNLIIESGANTIKAVDWEFCGIYPKGFDLLYYIFSVEFIIRKSSTSDEIIKNKYSIINNYYNAAGITDWKPYLKEFADICFKREGKTSLGENFYKLLIS